MGYAQVYTEAGICTMLLLEELGKCPFVGKGSTGEYLVYIVIQSSWAKLVLVLTT